MKMLRNFLVGILVITGFFIIIAGMFYGGICFVALLCPLWADIAISVWVQAVPIITIMWGIFSLIGGLLRAAGVWEEEA